MTIAAASDLAVALIAAAAAIALVGLTIVLIKVTLRRPELTVAFTGQLGANHDGRIQLGVSVTNGGDTRARRVRVSAWVNNVLHSEVAPVDVPAGRSVVVHLEIRPPIVTGETVGGWPKFAGQVSACASCGRTRECVDWPYS